MSKGEADGWVIFTLIAFLCFYALSNFSFFSFFWFGVSMTVIVTVIRTIFYFIIRVPYFPKGYKIMYVIHDFKIKNELIIRVFHTIKRILKENDRKVDIRKTYYESGALFIETTYINGEIHGVKKYHYESGALEWKTPYVNGKEHGVKKVYYESGVLEWEVPYVNGVIHGVEKNYYGSGNLREKIPYVNGKKHGIGRYYSELAGSLRRNTVYENNMIVSETEY